MAHLSPSTIFSPSVARQQQATTKDWNYLDSWLSTKFNGKTPSPFERNNDTLKALLALAALNESADEERDLLANIEAKALEDLKAREEADPDIELLDSTEQALTREGQTSLDTLATTSVALDQSVPDIISMGYSIIDLQVMNFELDQTSDRISILESYLKKEMQQIDALNKELQSDIYTSSTDLTEQTTVYQRKAKALAARLPDLKDKVTSLTANMGLSEIRIENVKAEEDRFKQLMSNVTDLEMQVKSYHGLPQDTDLARLELESLRVELLELMRQRDSMFEGLVERESPRKRKS